MMIDKLEMFLAVARERHFGRAADALGITQPTLSSGIKQLEYQLGVTLILRGARYGGLTPEGETALNWARRIVGDTRQFKEEMRVQRSGLSGQLRLAVIPSALSHVSVLVARFCGANPNVRVTLRAQSSNEIQVMLDDLEIDAGISYLEEGLSKRMMTVPLYDEDYVLVCREDGPFVDETRLTWSALEGQKLCLLTSDMQNRRIIDERISAAGITPQAQIESNSTLALVAAVLEGEWMTVLSAEMARFLTAERPLRIVPIGDPAERHQIGLYAAKREPLLPVLSAFVKSIR